MFIILQFPSFLVVFTTFDTFFRYIYREGYEKGRDVILEHQDFL